MKGTILDIFGYGFMNYITEFLISIFRGAIPKFLFHFDFEPKISFGEIVTI